MRSNKAPPPRREAPGQEGQERKGSAGRQRVDELASGGATLNLTLRAAPQQLRRLARFNQSAARGRHMQATGAQQCAAAAISAQVVVPAPPGRVIHDGAETRSSRRRRRCNNTLDRRAAAGATNSKCAARARKACGLAQSLSRSACAPPPPPPNSSSSSGGELEFALAALVRSLRPANEIT